MKNGKILKVELLSSNRTGGYYSAVLELPATPHQIEDAKQKARMTDADGRYNEVSVLESVYPVSFDLMRLDRYFLYKAPLIDSAHSAGSISDCEAEDLFDKMMDATGLKKKNTFLLKIRKDSWKKYGLDEYIIDFEDSRLLCNRFKAETNLKALLRHIRNSLAHGYIYVWKKKKGNYILLIDFETKEGSAPRITAKILISESILKQWKTMIELAMVGYS